MGRLLTPDRLAQDPDGAILEDVTIKGASTSLTALSLTPHALAPVAELPMLEIVRRYTWSATSPSASAGRA